MSIAHLDLQATFPFINPHQHTLWPLTAVMQENKGVKRTSTSITFDRLTVNPCAYRPGRLAERHRLGKESQRGS